MSLELEIQMIAIIVAVACSLPGVFLVLRKMSMMSDAITHTILLGIVIAFFITPSFTSPLLIIGATLMGVFTVVLTETLNNTRLVSEDSAIGVVFPLLFSIAIIIISRYAGSIHLDTDAVLLGELAYAPFNRLYLFGMDLGPKSIYSMGTILVLNLSFVLLFFKELKIATFDPSLSAILGFSPGIIHYGLMTLVSVTTVGAFESVGSILVIAFMIGPPITAYLITDNLKRMIFLSALIGAINAIIGYQVAALLDISIAGTMAVVIGIIFLLVFVFAPKRGLIMVLRRRRKQKIEFAGKSLLFHMYNHEGDQDEREELGIDSIKNHIKWEKNFLDDIIVKLQEDKKIFIEDDILKFTEEGRKYAVESYEEIVSGF